MTETFFVTKGVIATGKIVEMVLEPSAASPDYAYSISTYRQQYRIERDAFRSLDAAVAAARAKRDKKVASLRKQIAKLEKMTF